MSRLSKKSDIEIKEFLVDKLEDLITNDKTTTRDLIKSIELVGREYGLFIERKQINVDIHSVVRQLTDDQLKVLSGQVGDRGDYIDVLPGLDGGEGNGPASAGPAEPSGPSGPPGVGPEDQPQVDSGLVETDRKETR